MTHVVNVLEDVTELKRAELAERLLADASGVLASTPSTAALEEIASMVVRNVADWWRRSISPTIAARSIAS